MHQVTFSKFAAVAAGWLLALAAGAEGYYTVDVQGIVTEVRSSRGLLPAALANAQVGQPFSFRYYIQDLVPDVDSSPGRGQYNDAMFDIAEKGVFATVSVAGQAFALPSPTGGEARDRAHGTFDNVTVGSSGIVRDQLSYQKVSCAGSTATCYNMIVLTYRDATAGQPVPDALTSDAFVAAPTALGSFSTRTMRFHAGSASNVRIQSSVDSIIGTISSVTVTSGIVPPAPPPAATRPSDPCNCPCAKT